MTKLSESDLKTIIENWQVPAFAKVRLMKLLTKQNGSLFEYEEMHGLVRRQVLGTMSSNNCLKSLLPKEDSDMHTQLNSVAPSADYYLSISSCSKKYELAGGMFVAVRTEPIVLKNMNYYLVTITQEITCMNAFALIEEREKAYEKRFCGDELFKFLSREPNLKIKLIFNPRLKINTAKTMIFPTNASPNSQQYRIFCGDTSNDNMEEC